MPDYFEKIEIKEIGIVTLKVKTKDAETFLFDEEVVVDIENLESEEAKNSVEEFYNNEISRLSKQYKDGIPKEELVEARKLADAMGIYWKTQSGFSEFTFDDLAGKIANIKSHTDRYDHNDALLKNVFKEMLFLYIKEKNNNYVLQDLISKLEKETVELRKSSESGLYDKITSLFARNKQESL